MAGGVGVLLPPGDPTEPPWLGKRGVSPRSNRGPWAQGVWLTLVHPTAQAGAGEGCKGVAARGDTHGGGREGQGER